MTAAAQATPAEESASAPTLPAEKYQEEARHYLTQLVTEHPDSKFRKKAEEALHNLGDAKPEEKKN